MNWNHLFLAGLAFLGPLCASAQSSIHRSNMPWVDLSEQKERQLLISPGTETLYNGHPTTVMLDDQQTIFCTWSYNHGGKVGFLSRSDDGGRHWTAIPTPSDWASMSNCPSIYNLRDLQSKERLFVFAAHPQMSYTYSEDLGQTWSAVRSLNKPCVMAFSSIVRLQDGSHLGIYHRGATDADRRPLTLWQSVSTDGGLTWGASVQIGVMAGRSPCEPFVFRSSNGHRLWCVARENDRVGNSLTMYSDDEGRTWSALREAPWGLTGDRHIIKPTSDGRLVAVFRDMASGSPTKGHFVAWVGFEKDLREETSGQYRIKLVHSYQGSDCGYPGLEVLPDGTVLAITYAKLRPGSARHSIVAVRFSLAETDAMIR